jgi:hypothetical protein
MTYQFQNQFAPHLSQEKNKATHYMTTQINNSDDNNPGQPIEERCLQLSSKLDQAIANLRALPEFQEITREQGHDASTMAALKLLHETRPELFNPQNPADGLAALYAGMD